MANKPNNKQPKKEKGWHPSSPLPNKKHENFLQYHIVMRHLPGMAYRATGFKPKSDEVANKSATALLATPAVMARAAYMRSILADKAIIETGITRERVLTEMATLGLSNPLDYWTVGPDGKPTINLLTMSRQQAAAIQEIAVDKNGNVRIKLFDKRPALKDLGLFLGVFKPDVFAPAAPDPGASDRRERVAYALLEMIEDRVARGLPPIMQKRLAGDDATNITPVPMAEKPRSEHVAQTDSEEWTGGAPKKG